VSIYTHVHVHTISAELPEARQRFFRLGVQKYYNFSLGGAEIGEKNQDNEIQNITLCNRYFLKKIHAVYNGVWGKAPAAGEFSRILVLKVTLQSLKLLLTVSYRKNWGATAPLIIL